MSSDSDLADRLVVDGGIHALVEEATRTRRGPTESEVLHGHELVLQHPGASLVGAFEQHTALGCMAVPGFLVLEGLGAVFLGAGEGLAAERDVRKELLLRSERPRAASILAMETVHPASVQKKLKKKKLKSKKKEQKLESKKKKKKKTKEKEKGKIMAKGKRSRRRRRRSRMKNKNQKKSLFFFLSLDLSSDLSHSHYSRYVILPL